MSNDDVITHPTRGEGLWEGSFGCNDDVEEDDEVDAVRLFRERSDSEFSGGDT